MAQVISLSDAATLSNNVLVEGIIADIVSVDEWFKYLPFVTFEGLAYTFTREATLAGADFASPNTSLNATKYQKGATFVSVNVNLTAIIAEIILDGQIEDQFSESNDQLQVQISAKAKIIARTYMNAIVNAKRTASLVQSNNGPIGIADRFHGMASILDAESGNADDVNHPFYNNGTPTQSLDLMEDDPASARFGYPGRTYTLEDLDDLIDRVTSSRPDFLMMNSREIRTLRTLLRNTGGGTDAWQVQQQGIGSMKPMLYFQDIPVFRNDYVSKADPVNTFSTTVASVTDADTIVLSAAPSGVAGGASNFKYLLLRGTDGVMYRYSPTGYSSGTSVDVASTSGLFFDPEQNKLVSRVALNTSGLFTAGQEAIACERIDGSSIYCGAWGEFKGIAGFTSSNNAGLKLEYVGPRENENAYQYRMKWYCGFELYNRLSLARMKEVLPLTA
jgi:hypothetical protein